MSAQEYLETLAAEHQKRVDDYRALQEAQEQERTDELPSSLFEREGRILLNLLESWWACANLALEIAKEQLIGFINALNNVLNGLRANKIPVREAVKLFRLGQMFHQLKLVDSLAK